MLIKQFLSFGVVVSAVAQCSVLTYSAQRARAQFGSGTLVRCDVLGDVDAP